MPSRMRNIGLYGTGDMQVAAEGLKSQRTRVLEVDGDAVSAMVRPQCAAVIGRTAPGDRKRCCCRGRLRMAPTTRPLPKTECHRDVVFKEEDNFPIPLPSGSRF